DIFIRQAVKAVAPDAFVVERTGQRKAVRELRVAAMEGRVEAGDLRQVGMALAQYPDRREIAGLVQWRQRNKTLQRLESTVIDQDRLRIDRAPMKDAMADSDDLIIFDLVRQPDRNDALRLRRVGDLGGREGALDQDLPVMIFGLQARFAP